MRLPVRPIFAILVTIYVIISLTGCKNNFSQLVGKVYLYEDSVVTLTAGFDNDTLFYIMKDIRQPFFFKAPYESRKIDDSTFEIKVSQKPNFWEKDTWEIVIKNDKEFTSKESRKTYKIYSDTLFRFE